MEFYLSKNEFNIENELKEVVTIKCGLIKKFNNKRIFNKFYEYEESDLCWLKNLYPNIDFYDYARQKDIVNINNEKYIIKNIYFIQYDNKENNCEYELIKIKTEKFS